MKLSEYKGPSDLQSLDLESLDILAGDLRKYLIETVLEVGGHFAANLGVVELTLSILKHFHPEKHPIVWDVGHQSYPYKVLTGRKDALKNIRQQNGIAGFPKRSENSLDYFGTGHSSTSLSAMLGIAAGHQLSGNENRHIAIIGDGALSGGMSMEALNNLIDLPINCLIVFNDNGMGIDPNGGAIDRQSDEKIAELFSFFGLTYNGPIDGHDLAELNETFLGLSKKKGKDVVHVKTIKGKGYKPAEEEQTKWHSTPKFVKIQPQTPSTTWHNAFGEMIYEMAKEHSEIVGITPAMPTSSGMIKAMRTFPDRFFDVNIAEQHALTFAAGLAAAGNKPFVAIYSTFLQRAYDQLIHDIAIQNLPVVLCIDRAGLVGEDGPTHHGVFDISMILAVPNFQLFAPATTEELKHALEIQINSNQPSAIRYPKGSVSSIELIPQTHQYLLKNPKSKVLMISTGKATELANLAYQEGVNTESLDHLHILQIKPFPSITFDKSYDCVVTVEDGQIQGGFGHYCLSKIPFTGRVIHLGIQDEFVPHGKNENLYEMCGYGSNSIKELLQTLLG